MDGQTIRAIRAELKMTQVQLAAALHVNTLTLRQWENDEPRHTPNYTLLALALDALVHLRSPAVVAARERASFWGWSDHPVGAETYTAAQPRELRDRLGMSQNQYGVAIGVQGTTVSRWEVGGANHRQPNLELLAMATDALQHLNTPATQAARERARLFGWQGIPVPA